MVIVTAGGARASCEPVRITTEPAEPAGDWQAAILELMQQTRRAGMPWSCSGGALVVQLDDDERAVLRFRDGEGRVVQRHVPSPRALVPTAEALLASAPPREAPPPSAIDEVERALEQPPLDVAPAEPARPRKDPRYLLDATLGVRFSGPTPTLWLAPELRATVPFEAWSGGVWVRYGLPYVFDSTPKEFFMAQVNLGLSAGRQLISAPVDLRLTFNPSLSVVSMDADPAEGQEASGAKVDIYLGLGLSAAIPFTETWRGVLLLDAEMVPASIRAERRVDPALPVLPAYEIGAAFGVELVAR